MCSHKQVQQFNYSLSITYQAYKQVKKPVDLSDTLTVPTGILSTRNISGSHLDTIRDLN